MARCTANFQYSGQGEKRNEGNDAEVDINAYSSHFVDGWRGDMFLFSF